MSNKLAIFLSDVNGKRLRITWKIIFFNVLILTENALKQK